MASNEKSGLLTAYHQLLAPLVRILLRNSVSAKEFNELSKLVFVEVATQQLKATHTKPTSEQVALITGLTTEEVQRTLNAGQDLQGGAQNLSRVTRILSAWHTDNYFTGPYGLPLELPVVDPKKPDFSKLVAKHCPEADPKTLLDELLRIGAVRETETNWYKVLTRTYVPEVDDPASLERLGYAVGKFVETIDFNRAEENPEKRMFERIVDADDGIRPEDLPRFKIYVRERAQLLLEDIDNWLSQLDPPDSDSIANRVNTGLGIYHYVEEKKTKTN